MSVRYGAPEAFAQVVGVYSCTCGRTEDRYGIHAGELPPGWVRIAGEREQPEHVCPDCAASLEPRRAWRNIG
jgi:hypothetical protein